MRPKRNVFSAGVGAERRARWLLVIREIDLYERWT